MRISDWSSDVCSSDLSGFFELVRKAHKQHQLVLINLGTLLRQCRKIFPVHSQNEIEFAEVVGRALPSHAMRKIVAALARSSLGAGVGRFADMEAVGASSIDAHHRGEARFVDYTPENTLHPWRAADKNGSTAGRERRGKGG